MAASERCSREDGQTGKQNQQGPVVWIRALHESFTRTELAGDRIQQVDMHEFRQSLQTAVLASFSGRPTRELSRDLVLSCSLRPAPVASLPQHQPPLPISFPGDHREAPLKRDASSAAAHVSACQRLPLIHIPQFNSQIEILEFPNPTNIKRHPCKLIRAAARCCAQSTSS